MLSTQPAPGLSAEEEQKNQSFTTSLVNKIVDNLQIEVGRKPALAQRAALTRRRRSGTFTSDTKTTSPSPATRSPSA